MISALDKMTTVAISINNVERKYEEKGIGSFRERL